MWKSRVALLAKTTISPEFTLVSAALRELEQSLRQSRKETIALCWRAKETLSNLKLIQAAA